MNEKVDLFSLDVHMKTKVYILLLLYVPVSSVGTESVSGIGFVGVVAVTGGFVGVVAVIVGGADVAVWREKRALLCTEFLSDVIIQLNMHYRKRHGSYDTSNTHKDACE